MKTETIESPPPTEVLIPEARQHQRQRYQRRSVRVVIAALVLAALILSAVLLVRGPAAEGKTQADPKPVAAAGASGAVVYFRPVLCFAPAYAAPTGVGANVAPRGTEIIPACAADSLLSAANMDVSPTSGSVTGYSSRNIDPDPQYASYPSTSVDEPRSASSTVLLPGLNGACDQVKATRCVLGPAEMSSRAIAKATATQTQTGQWIVDYTTTDAGAAVWDKVANENFHQLLAIELNGVVYTAPLLQPTQSSFSSFDGRGELSGGLNRSEAVHLASALSSHKG
jgi:hypothetical protein